MDSNHPPPPPPPHSSSYTSFPILAISILGILTTAILLLSYYLFVVKCCLNWRRPHLLLWPRFSSYRSRRHLTPIHPHILHHSPAEPRGLDPSTINSIPTFRFSSSNTNTTTSSSSIECAVCLADFRHQELLRLLPVCSHAFHIDCIDTWLQFNPNCPLCRADISLFPIQQQHFSTTSNTTASNPQPPTQQDSGHVVIDMRDTSGSSTSGQTPTRPTPKSSTKSKKFWQMASMGDECIDIRERDERFAVQPIRRSFSMDSSNDRQLYVSVQEILRHNPNLFQEVRNGEETSGGGGGGGRTRRSFFSFGRSSRSAASVLPVQSELL